MSDTTDIDPNDNNYDSRFQRIFENDFQNVNESDFNDDAMECEMMLAKSVSMSFTDFYDRILYEQQMALNALSAPNGRNKLFNGNFKLFKKKDVIPTIQNYKCGQTLECFVSFIQDTNEFYVQQSSRLNHLKDLDDCIQNYANVLIESHEIARELLAFQSNTAKFDVVLAKAKFDNKWHRAIYLGNLL